MRHDLQFPWVNKRQNGSVAIRIQNMVRVFRYSHGQGETPTPLSCDSQDRGQLLLGIPRSLRAYRTIPLPPVRGRPLPNRGEGRIEFKPCNGWNRCKNTPAGTSAERSISSGRASYPPPPPVRSGISPCPPVVFPYAPSRLRIAGGCQAGSRSVSSLSKREWMRESRRILEALLLPFVFRYLLVVGAKSILLDTSWYLVPGWHYPGHR